MNNETFEELIKRFVRDYDGPKLAITSAGGGASFADLLKIPGSSRIIHSIRFPCHREAVERCLDETGRKFYQEKAVSLRVATDLAWGSFKLGDDVISIGVTSSLTSDRHRKGLNESCLVISWPQGKSQLESINLVYQKLEELPNTTQEEFSKKRIEEDQDIVSYCLRKLLQKFKNKGC